MWQKKNGAITIGIDKYKNYKIILSLCYDQNKPNDKYILIYHDEYTKCDKKILVNVSANEIDEYMKKRGRKMKDCKDQELCIGDEIVFPHNCSTSCYRLRFARVTGFKGKDLIKFEMLEDEYISQSFVACYKVWKYNQPCKVKNEN